MRELGLTTRHDFIAMARCLSLTDTFWMKRTDEAVTWDEVSLYRNPFDDVIARIAFDGTGMYGRQNSPTSPEFATSGSFAKCWVREGDDISLFKRGSIGYANAGFEPYSEVLAAELLDAAAPEIALISAGAGNSYGHPAPETLERFAALGAQVRRTDLEGTIVLFVRDGAVGIH